MFNTSSIANKVPARGYRSALRLAGAFAVVAAGLSVQPFGISSAGAQQLQLQPRLSGDAEFVLNTAKWCADYRRGGMGVAPTETDLARLKLAQAVLAPGFDFGARRDSLALLAAYREELEQVHPDATEAASFLAMASAVPITFAMVERLNTLLCVSSTRALAQAVATSAETMRRQSAG